MREATEKISIKEYLSYEDIPEYAELVCRARAAARDTSYSPYSGFKVGAALLLENGEFICGSNQENASYSMTVCAERVALFSASARFPGVNIKALAIAAYDSCGLVRSPVTPCGACRQVLLEYECRQKLPIKIIMSGETSVLVSENARSLLPFSFSSEFLE